MILKLLTDSKTKKIAWIVLLIFAFVFSLVYSYVSYPISEETIRKIINSIQFLS